MKKRGSIFIGVIIFLVMILIVGGIFTFFYLFNEQNNFNIDDNVDKNDINEEYLVYDGCGIVYNIYECNYDPINKKADVKIKLIKGDVDGFVGWLRTAYESDSVYDHSQNNQIIEIKGGETKIIQFDYSKAINLEPGPYKMDLNPMINGGVCLEVKAEINCNN